jgi:NAD(P)-dependent dehydrogenase (short-subunit alcohol dehydrogenase family)
LSTAPNPDATSAAISVGRDRGAVVVTGASTGIGRACAFELDARGFRVFAGVRRDVDGEALRAAASPRLTPLSIDVTDPASIAAAVAVVEAATGIAGLTGLVNNAGIAVPGTLEYLDIDRIRRQFDVNVIGQIAVTQAFLPAIRQATGRIVNMGSISGRLAAPFIAPYAMSKHALEAFSDALRMELRPWKIHVALIEPGAVRTEIWEKGLQTADEIVAEMPEEGYRRYERAIESIKRTTAALGADGVPPAMVARAVVHALAARRPKTRYLVGRDARIEAILRRWLPDRWLDRLVLRQIGL